MKNTIELAAEFIRRAAFVDANNALLKDECSVEYKKPSQVVYDALFKDHDDSRAFNEALKHVADMLGCMTFDASELPGWAFFKLDNPDMWVSNTGRFHTNEELVAILRDATGSIQVVGACDLH